MWLGATIPFEAIMELEYEHEGDINTLKGGGGGDKRQAQAQVVGVARAWAGRTTQDINAC